MGLARLSISEGPLDGVDDGIVVHPRGPIRAREGEAFRTHIDALLKTQPSNLVIDFGQCEGIDSSAAGYLLMLHDKLRESGGRLALADLPQSVQMVIDSIGLTSFFTVCDTVGDAATRIRDGD